MTDKKTIAMTNSDNAERLWEVLEAYRGDPMTRWDLIELADFTDPHAQGRDEIFTIAIKRCRMKAEKLGMFIPMAAPQNGYRYVMTSDPSLVIDGFYHSSRVARGYENLNRKHSDFIETHKGDLPASQRRLFEEILDGQNEIHEARIETEKKNMRLMKDLNDLLREEEAAKRDEVA